MTDRVSRSDNFDWLVKARASNQEVLLRLHRFAKENSERLQCDPTGRSVFALLVGASFSLWRAAFLSDASRKWSTTINDATVLLERLVRDNAVAYPQDRETREWMSGYYLNSAQWRLLIAWRYLDRDGTAGPMPEALSQLKEIEEESAEQEPPIVLWEKSDGALRELLEIMQARLSKR